MCKFEPPSLLLIILPVLGATAAVGGPLGDSSLRGEFPFRGEVFGASPTGSAPEEGAVDKGPLRGGRCGAGAPPGPVRGGGPCFVPAPRQSLDLEGLIGTGPARGSTETDPAGCGGLGWSDILGLANVLSLSGIHE